MTTAQAGPSMSDPQAYREKMFKLLASRDPLEVLAQTASTLADIVGKHSATVLRSRPFEGKWTPNEISSSRLLGSYRRSAAKWLSPDKLDKRTSGIADLALDLITMSAPPTRVDCGLSTTKGSGGRSRTCSL